MIDQNWVNTTNASHPERFQYGHDRDGNLLYQANLVNTSQSELYRANSAARSDSNSADDPLGSLAAFSRGARSSSDHVSLVPQSDILDEALRLAMEIGHTLQDRLYLAVARRLDATLVAADNSFYHRAKASYKLIFLLPGCKTN